MGFKLGFKIPAGLFFTAKVLVKDAPDIFGTFTFALSFQNQFHKVIYNINLSQIRHTIKLVRVALMVWCWMPQEVSQNSCAHQVLHLFAACDRFES